MAVELGGIALEHLTHVSVREEGRIVHHAVPGMAGELAQTLGRPSVAVSFSGIFYGPDAADDLNSLRTLYLAQDPVDFFAEAVGEGYFAQVLISRIEVSQRAGFPDQFDLYCEVVEYVEPPEPAIVDPLAQLDTDLLGEATSFMDDVQNALEEVSQLTDLIANVPSFGDPTTRLPEMLDDYGSLIGSGASTLNGLRDLF